MAMAMAMEIAMVTETLSRHLRRLGEGGNGRAGVG